ncbi:leucine-rich repeat-containing protein 40-like [Anthonomus grandis grandis]|uniref:leucine-rich repeat-containing protein 40-like n=1 Tax=Anthonomus grandis grandis TaxID=2921223 RepID=UPI002165F73D|nr:leucine-rich repeat-containing protein 40-like [Anthonomus grandis grandis]
MSVKGSKMKNRRKMITPVFHVQTQVEDEQHFTKEFIKEVKRTGVINLHGKHLSTVPDKLFGMHEEPGYIPDPILEFPSNDHQDIPWWLHKPLTSLDLSSNVITEIPNKICMYGDGLTYLNLQDNCLKNLPQDITYLKDLTKLILNRNKLTELPKDIYKMGELRLLSFNHNCIEQLPNSLVDLVMLEKLEMSSNKIKKLPSGMGYLVRLVELDVSNNKLTELPPDIVNLRSLTVLNINHNEITHLPESLGEMRKLQILYAQHNRIEIIPDFTGCDFIQEIYFGNNCIKELPLDLFDNLQHLKIFELRDNRISILPPKVVNLMQLTKLDLTNNALEEIPCVLSLLPHLQSLKLEGNQLKSIRSDVIRTGTQRIMQFLKEKLTEEDLEMLPMGLSCVPADESVFPDRHRMRHGNILNLAMKDLTFVPEEVFRDAKEVRVSTVDLCKNKFTQVPDGLLGLSDWLTELNMSSNHLKEVPSTFANFTKLKFLDLSRNMLSGLPNELEILVGLRELILSNNRFTKIPQCVYGMVGLEVLMFNDNSLEEINVEGLKQLTRLATLSLGNNNICYVPPELGYMTQLRCLELRGNSFRQPRYAILDKGTESILSYLRDKIAV